MLFNCCNLVILSLSLLREVVFLYFSKRFRVFYEFLKNCEAYYDNKVVWWRDAIRGIDDYMNSNVT